MAYRLVNRLPDRYKVVFRNLRTGERRRVWLTKEEWDRPDFQLYIPSAYGQGLGPEWYWWPIGHIDTYDTPSGDLEPGTTWEGTRARTDPATKVRRDVRIVVWKDEQGTAFEGATADVEIMRSGDTIETIGRKRS